MTAGLVLAIALFGNPQISIPRLEQKIHALINSERQAKNIKPLVLDEQPVGRNFLTSAIDVAAKGDKESRIFLQADKTVPYGEMVEVMNLLRAAGRNQEAAAVYRKIWQAGKEGRYPNLHYEAAALSLGDLLRSQKDYSGAAAAYEQVSQVPQPDPQVLQRNCVLSFAT